MSGSPAIVEIVPGLYQLDGAPSPSSLAAGDLFSYFLARDPKSPSLTPDADELWNDPTLVGWYLFVGEQITEAEGDAFVRAGRAGLPSLVDNPNQPNPRTIVWMQTAASFDGPSLYSYGIGPTDPVMRGTVADVTFEFGGFQLTIPGQSAILPFSSGTLQITTTVVLKFYGTLQTVFPYGPSSPGWLLNLDLTGPLAGTLVQPQMALDYSALQANFGCSLRYFYPENGSSQMLEYAFLTPAPAPGSDFLGLNLYLHPIKPSDYARSRLELDLGTQQYQQNSANLRAPYLRTTKGGQIVLAPAAPATPGVSHPPGWGFCAMPASPATPGSPNAEPPLYLAPAGTFAVESIDPPGSPGTAQTSANWMPGLFAQEFLELSAGDHLELISNQPANAASFRASSSSSTPAALDSTGTTSWVRFPILSGANQPGYFGQSKASVYYGARSGDPFPRALTAHLASLDGPMLFPVGPYGGIFANGNASPNVEAQAYAAFEATILSGVRHAQAPLLANGPQFYAAGTHTLRFTRALAAAAADQVATGTTPQGFLAGLDEHGRWLSLTLACSPDSPTETIGFEGGSPSAPVSPELAGALLEGQVFLVISDPAEIGQFSNTIVMGGFRFTLDIGGETGAELGTVLVFKYNTSQTLADLIVRPELWSNKPVGSPNGRAFIRDLAGTQAILQNALVQAGIHSPANSAAAESSPFTYFQQIAMDPEWTGVLAFNCAIDGNGMPLDLQVLLGGINGQLRAHHLGIQSTPIRPGSPKPQSSSLFGVIHYPSTTEPALDPSPNQPLSYEIETLNVVFANSKITQFHVTAGLTANQLFGRTVELTPPSSPGIPANTCSIPGQYQMQGAVGVVTFATATPFTFAFPVPEGSTRVLQQIVIEGASLVPVSSTPNSSGGTDVVAHFLLNGQMFLNAEPFPQTGIDLFSFGNDHGGLSFANLNVRVTFTLDQYGAAGKQQVTFDPSTITLTPSPLAIREKSLLYALPLQLSSFDSGTALQSLAKSCTPLHVLELEGHPGALVTPVTPTAVSPQPQPGSWPYVTDAPAFALEFDLPLGSLGSLSDAHAGIMARLLLGWGPSPLVPDADAAAVLVQLPQLSAGYGGFNLQGILKTTFGDANLLKVDLENGPTYAILFSNVKLSVLGYSFPPGYTINFLLFAGSPAESGATNTSNIAWFIGAQPSGSPS